MTHELTMKEIGTGVAEVYAGTYQVGMITWFTEPMGRLRTQWYATYANSDETIPYPSRQDALESLRLQHAAVQRLARSLRSIRPAPESGNPLRPEYAHDKGYNSALRDVERLLQEVVGQAPDGEGFTAITR